MSTFHRSALAVVIGVFTSSAVVQAQVGLTSGVAQVALHAHVAPHGSLQLVTPTRERSRSGPVREVATSLRVTANTGYRLTVRRAQGTTARIWIRNATGEFQALTGDSSVMVARDSGSRGDSVREVLSRIETTGTAPAESSDAVPVWYELAIEPTM